MSEVTTADKRAQVTKQLKAVAHLATLLAEVSSQLARLYHNRDCKVDELVEMVGDRTAHQMEVLGDMLNAMDAVSEEDEWLDPIYEAAHRLWPQGAKTPPVHRADEGDGT